MSGALEDYTPNAAMIYTGDTFGIGGDYKGTENIRVTLQTLFGEATNFHFTIEAFNSTIKPNESAVVGADFAYAGLNRLIGEFNGTISAQYRYVYRNGTWLISEEFWNFVTGNYPISTAEILVLNRSR